MSDATTVAATPKDENDQEDRRRQQRWKVFEFAAVTGAAGSAACVIDNLSVSGALVSADITLEADERVTFDLDEFGEIPARVVHIRGSLIGLAFEFDQAGETKLRHWLEEIEKEGRA